MPPYRPLEALDPRLRSAWNAFITPLPSPPNGGVVGWSVVLATFINIGITFGLEATFGQLSVFILEDPTLDISSSSLAWTISVLIFFELLLGMVVAYLVVKFGARLVVASGAVLLSSGLFLASSATSPAVFFASYAIMGGTGLALCYGASSMALGDYFTTRMDTASSFSGAGAGLITMAMSQLISYLESSYGWRVCLRTLAVLIGMLSLASSLAFVPVVVQGAVASVGGAEKQQGAQQQQGANGVVDAQQPHLTISIPPPSAQQPTTEDSPLTQEDAHEVDVSPGDPPSPLHLSSPRATAAGSGAKAATAPSSISPTYASAARTHPSPPPASTFSNSKGSPFLSSASVVLMNIRATTTPQLAPLATAPPKPKKHQVPWPSPRVSSPLASSKSASKSSSSGGGGGGGGGGTSATGAGVLGDTILPADATAKVVEKAAAAPKGGVEGAIGGEKEKPPSSSLRLLLPPVFFSPGFWSIALCMAFLVSSTIIPEIFLGSFVEESLLPPSVASTAYTLMGLAGLVARLGLGGVSLFFEMDMLLLLQFCVVALGAGMMGLAAHGALPAYLYAYALLSGAATNLAQSCVPPVLLRLYGAENLPAALGGTYTLRAPAVLLAAPLADLARGALGGFAGVWTIAGVLCLLSSFPVCLVHLKCARKGRGGEVRGGGGGEGGH